MKTIVVTEQTSSVMPSRSLHNRVVWRHVNGQREVLAVGVPEEWRSPAAMPPSAVTTDLIAASVEDAALATLLWGAFLSYLARPYLPGWHSALPRFLRPSVPVSVVLPTGAMTSAVSSAIEKSRGPVRFKVNTVA